MLTRYDKVLICFLLFLALLSFAICAFGVKFEGLKTFGGREVVIFVSGREVARYPLVVKRERIEIEGPLGTSLVEINGGKVRMLTSPCPNKICVGQGWIEGPNQVIVCAPNRVIVKIAGGRGDELDAVSR
ncbi:MAG: NusG domain II-containing protein [Actinomycetota bacterium]|nr:NusG domain II-containing protein [Actinomycetota bacterium]